LGVWDVAFSPDGQLLAEYCRAGGIRFWNVVTGKELAEMPDQLGCCLHFHPDGKGLIIAGDHLYRWPIHQAGETNTTVRLGPRAALFAGGALYSDLSTQGRFLVAAQRSEAAALVFDLEHPSSQPVVLRPHPNVQRVAISPDGRFVATGTWHGSGVKVW